MTDIPGLVERLRATAFTPDQALTLIGEAADALERMEALVDVDLWDWDLRDREQKTTIARLEGEVVELTKVCMEHQAKLAVLEYKGQMTTSDLVKRLRDRYYSGHHDEAFDEATDEIERLEATRTGLLARCDQLADHRNALQATIARLEAELQQWWLDPP